jgi:hypothetical protein
VIRDLQRMTGERQESPAAFSLPVAMTWKNSGLTVGARETRFPGLKEVWGDRPTRPTSMRSASKWRVTSVCGFSRAILIRTIWSVQEYRSIRRIGAIRRVELVDYR